MPPGPISSIPEKPGPPIGAEVSLAQIAVSGIAITWYEAVAIIQQICRALPDQPGHPALDSATVFIQSSGDVTIQSATSGDADEAVQWLGELLRIWLCDTPYPMPLRLVVAQATCTPPFYRSIAELSEALSHYERSNRHELVRDVYEHWRNAEPLSGETPGNTHSAASNAELRHKLRTFWRRVPAGLLALGEFARSTVGALLRGAREQWQRRRARPGKSASDGAVQESRPDAPAVIVPVQDEPGRSRPMRLNARVISMAAAVTLFIAIAVWLALSGFGHSTENTVSTAIGRADDRVVDTLASTFAGALNWLGSDFVRKAGFARETAAAPPAAAPVDPDPHVTARATQARREGVAAAPADEPNSEPGTGAQAPAAAVSLPAALEPPALDRRVVYSVADADVTPPIPIGRQLPDSLPSGGQQQNAAAIDIVVDETGRVESATLARKPATLQETMLAMMNLSAAKTWQFRPALRAGRPVKYRRTVWLANR